TMRELEKYWLPAMQAGKFLPEPRKITFALQAVGSEKVVKPLLALLKSTKVAADRAVLLGLLARVGGPEELDLVLKEAGSTSSPRTIMLALEEAARERGILPTQRKPLLKLMETVKEDRAIGYRLAGLYKMEEARGTLVGVVA